MFLLYKINVRSLYLSHKEIALKNSKMPEFMHSWRPFEKLLDIGLARFLSFYHLKADIYFSFHEHIKFLLYEYNCLDGIKIQWHRKLELTTIILPGF